jgi:phosphate transport system substrate-binding protein
MNNNAFILKAFHRTRWMIFPLFLFIFSACGEQQERDSALSGRLTVAVDRQLDEIAKMEAGMFRRYYPGAGIEVNPSPPVKTLEHLLDNSARAAIISGDFDAAEDSLFHSLKKQMRREPVALDAIICIAGSNNSVAGLSIKELNELFSGRKKGAETLILKDDYRLLSQFSSMTGTKKTDIHVWSCGNIDEMLTRVTASGNAYALLFASSLEAARKSGKEMKTVKILPVSKNEPGSTFCLPERDAVFENRYPLVTTVYYVYYPGDALAAGFGSWISSSGQKAFERSSYVPFRLTQRTIILK